MGNVEMKMGKISIYSGLKGCNDEQREMAEVLKG